MAAELLRGLAQIALQLLSFRFAHGVALLKRLASAERYQAEHQRPSTVHIERDMPYAVTEQGTQRIMLSKMRQRLGRPDALLSEGATCVDGILQRLEALSDQMRQRNLCTYPSCASESQ
jgi:hypothetical protein